MKIEIIISNINYNLKIKVNKINILLNLSNKKLHVKYLLDFLYHFRNKINITLFRIDLSSYFSRIIKNCFIRIIIIINYNKL